MSGADETIEPAPPLAAKPHWRRVADFPLVALVAALAVFFVAIAVLVALLALLPLGAMPKWVEEALIAFVSTIAAVASLKLVIARLGENPVDDLPFDRRAYDGWRGALAAAVLMSAIVGIAALLGAYRIAGWGGGTSWAMLLFSAGHAKRDIPEAVAAAAAMEASPVYPNKLSTLSACPSG